MDKHEDQVVSISGYTVFREDRKHRTGGGVAVWVKNSIPVHRCIHITQPLQFESLTLIFPSFKFIFVTIYVPPETALRESYLVNNFLIDHVEEIHTTIPDFEIILCGDLNRLNTGDVITSLNLNDLHEKPTYGDAQLDYVLVSENLSDRYTVTDSPPIDISKVPHIALLATPTTGIKHVSYIYKSVYDLRASKVDDFGGGARKD